MAVIKYLTETGNLALPSDSIPHSKFSSLTFDFIRGLSICVRKSVVTTKPNATTICSSKGK
jgi:hypothetical protein